MPVSARLSVLLFCLCTLLASGENADAQEQTMIAQSGASVPGSYQPGGIDTINLQSGAVVLDIPILSYPQIGNQLKLSFSLKFSPTPWFYSVVSSGIDPSTDTDHYVGSWHNQDPQVTNPLGVTFVRDQGIAETEEQLTYPCTNSSGYCGGYEEPSGSTGVTATYADLYSLVTADKGIHNFGIEGVNGSPGVTFIPTLDGTNFTPINGASSGFIGPDGVTYTPAPNSSGAFNQTDPAGNTITVTSSGWTDSLGRLFPGSTSGPGVGVSTGVVNGDPLPGVQASDTSACTAGASAARTFTVPASHGQNAPYTLCFNNQAAATQFASPAYPNSFDYLITEDQGSGTYLFLTQLVLPNGTSYSFTYDNYLNVTSVTLPTGGTVTYGWVTAQWNDIEHQQSRVIQKRTVTNTDGSSNTWNYSISPFSDDTYSATSVITDPANNDEQHVFTYTNGNAIETITYYKGTGSSRSLLKTVVLTRGPANSPIKLPTQDGSQPYVAGPVLSSVTTWAATNQVSQIIYTQTPGTGSVQYVDYNNNSNGPQNYAINTCDQCFQTMQTQTEKDYDYGIRQPGSLLRTTTTEYQWQQYATYHSANLLSLPYSSTIQDGSGNQAAQTLYSYDEANGSPQGTFGNATSVKRWISSSNYSTTSVVYSSAGVAQQTTDPNGNITKTTAFACNGAFPQTVVAPYGSSTPAETTGYSYDCSTGAKTGVTDPNNQSTSSSFDNLNRPLSVSYPDGGSKTWSYTDGTSSSVLVTTQTGEASGPIVNNTVYDGFGRVTETQLQSDPAGVDKVDTTYDALGRVQSVSNPYRSTSDATYGITSYLYDALGNTIDQCDPNNTTQASTTCVPTSSYIAFSYSGSTTLTRDENGNKHQQNSDGLGRLTQVLEPDTNNNLSIETDYQYDPLGNQKQVDQWGSLNGSSNSSTCFLPNGSAASGSACDRQRLYVYDGLSRLTSATDPETSTITYTYDDGDDLLTKTDARGITITYKYDGLNRLTGKTYTDGTPQISYYYDVPVQGWNFVPQSSPTWNGVQQTNLIGRLSYESNRSSTIVYGYDSLGRTTLKSLCTPSTCGSDHYDLHASYDLAGSPRFTDRGLDAVRNAASPNAGYYYGGLSLSYNGASELSQALADTVDAAHPQGILTNLNYTPLGGVYTAELGQQYGQASQYDNRGHMISRASINLAGDTVLADHWDYDLVGNLEDANDSQQGDFTYQYDTLNRVINANIPPFTETYNYDPWGNQTAHILSEGSSYQWSYTPTTHNQATNPGVSYDAAGNMLSDGLHNYTYDAEERVNAVTDQQVAYQYDPEGMRVATLSGGNVTAEYLYDIHSDLVTTVNSSGQLVRSILRTDGTHIGDYIGTADSSGNVSTEFRLVNQIGTLVANGDTSGNFVEGCLSGPFGDGQDCTPSYDYTETHFVDKLRDQESNNDYFGARYFNSTMGRFTSPDPSGLTYSNLHNPQSLNLYSYALNNPMTNTDPTGLSCITLDDGTQVDDGDGQGCEGAGILPTADAKSGPVNFDPNKVFNVNVNGGGSDGFEQGSLAAGLFGPQGERYFGPASGTVEGAGEVAIVVGTTIVNPGLGFAVGCTSGITGCSGVDAAFALFPELKALGLTLKEGNIINGVLKQIDSGATKGDEYKNLTGKLPLKRRGYYTEHTVPLPAKGRGVARIIAGSEGERYFTPDHYTSFFQIR